MIAVILSGGAGTRLWPVSRELYPKPFMRLPDGQSLLQKALLRAVGLGLEQILTVTGQEHLFATQAEYGKLELPEGLELSYIVEPLRRNTAPAIAMAAFKVAQQHPQQVMLVLSSDHLIDKQLLFAEAVLKAKRAAQQGYIVVFGLQPTYPATSFGYIEQGQALPSEQGQALPSEQGQALPSEQGESLHDGVFKVARFVEKPDEARAKEYMQSGRFSWNAGIFCFQAGTYLEALEAHAPEVYAAAKACWEASEHGAVTYLETKLFKAVPSISVDYAVMERAERVAVVPANFSWSDLGSWDAAAEMVPPDAEGNRVLGKAVMVESKNTFVQSEERMIAAVGVDDLVIVDTRDALLVAKRDRVQDVRKVVERLQKNNHNLTRAHRTLLRPWGNYTVLEDGPGFCIRRVVIRPGLGPGLQIHHHRTEHWVVMSGIARVTKGEQEMVLRENESITVPSATAHRIINPGIIDLVVIEIQTGAYLGEDDVIRLE
jgi:mannose-1-phosphate guanylyltransferase/mannose-1-phosphate guanylyltransferase/mannose-6-phosphate isomerase